MEQEKKIYCVNIVRYGCIFVEAESESAAMSLADQQKTDTVSWSEDWEPTDAEEYDDRSVAYVTKPWE